MNPKECMIIDLQHEGSKQMFITERIRWIKQLDNGSYRVSFRGSPSRFYTYSSRRLCYITHPKRIELEDRGLFVRNRRVRDVTEILLFARGEQMYYRIYDSNGCAQNLHHGEVYITRMPIAHGGGSLWSYLMRIAQETGLSSEDGANILVRQYSLVDLMRDNVPLAQYLGDKTPLAQYKRPDRVYYPFGCNGSQMDAVVAALTHQVSFIQGPPGTGKTQTILNIIANLLLKGKSILVVSNNNTAVENVVEKLQSEGLGFLVAQLGSRVNKQAFIAQQEGEYPKLEGWELSRPSTASAQVCSAYEVVSRAFEDQTRIAQLRAEKEALQCEVKYYDQLQEEDVEVQNWLQRARASKLMKLLSLCRRMAEQGRQFGYWMRLRWSLVLGWRAFGLLRTELNQMAKILERAYYISRRLEIEREIEAATERLRRVDLAGRLQELTSASLGLLKHELASRYRGGVRPTFRLQDIKAHSEDFLREYPIVVSTTYMARGCISPDEVFDYVIMDEASQVDLTTGVLALASARNAVIVGDDMQLPNVVGREEILALEAIADTYQIKECYDPRYNSFLSSSAQVFRGAPVTLLREHYRCHPRIIEFCNQRFYGGRLIPMTTDSGEEDVLRVIQTTKGNHARGHLNQREVEVITREIIPHLSTSGSVGVITPYRAQAQAINTALGREVASTVHKYQGRECDTIIMSLTDNAPTTFSDDANLLNVAISRAKKSLYVVATGNDLPPMSNLAQLIDYTRYHNFEVTESRLRSVFDLLYQQYTTERMDYLASHPVPAGEQLSERLLYEALEEALSRLRGWGSLAVLTHYPLGRLLADLSPLDEEERTFVRSPLSHVDFLIYNRLTRKPLIALEVDGWSYHQGSTTQRYRDGLKDQILTKYALTPLRLSTTDYVTAETLAETLSTRLRALSTPSTSTEGTLLCDGDRATVVSTPSV